MPQDLYKQLPAIDKWLATETGTSLSAEFSSQEVVEVMREHLDRVRRGLGNGTTELPEFDSPHYAALMREDLLKRRMPSLRSTVNATGIVIHTNLGRAPLAPEAIEAMESVARGYSNLELNLESGKRGSRYDHVESLMTRITGAEAAVVVNNCAAAVVLSLETMAAGREVVISRGELVEIGGSFRIPDVIAKSGARMVEVGTTNKTRVSDYAAALSENTRVVLAVHPSNYKIMGFSERPALKELASLAHQNDLVFVHDLGSGALTDAGVTGVIAEHTVQESLAAGADLVVFSGDKLLGGPQAGIIVGRAELVSAIKTNPLLRALRIDKVSLAALAATLRLYLPPNDPVEKIPVLRMINESQESVGRRARRLLTQLKKLPGVDGVLDDDVSYGGGGAMPMAEVPTKVLRVDVAGHSAGQLAEKLRSSEPAVIARISNDQLVIDPRTLSPEDAKRIVHAFRQVVE